MKYLVTFVATLAVAAAANSAETGFVRIKELRPRAGGWIHIVAEGQNDMDISNCGINNFLGMLLNFGDTNGTEVGKKALLSILLTAYAQGSRVNLGSQGCDSQYIGYSRLDYIDGIQ